MAHPPPYPDSGDDSGAAGPDRRPTAVPPRWVAVVAIIVAIILVLLIVLGHLSGAIGPGAH